MIIGKDKPCSYNLLHENEDIRKTEEFGMVHIAVIQR
jgi:hypothetical protein